MPEVNPNLSPFSGGGAAADFNENAIPEVVVGSAVILDGTTAQNVEVNGRLNPSYGQVLIADFNEDGHPDFVRTSVFVVSSPTSHCWAAADVWLGDGRGGFTHPAARTFVALVGASTS